jgi:hypothetical protein
MTRPLAALDLPCHVALLWLDTGCVPLGCATGPSVMRSVPQIRNLARRDLNS